MRLSSFFLIIVFICCLQPVYSQQPRVALHHEGDASFFGSLTEAYSAAINGDTIYIPGGNFEGIALAKSLVLIGVGHHPDSTAATGATILDYISLHAGADGSNIIGIQFNGNINAQESVANIIVSRCYLGAGFRFLSYGMSNWIISENWVGMWSPLSNLQNMSFFSDGSNNNLSNFIVSNNVVQGRTGDGRAIFFNSILSNNIFLESVYQTGIAGNYSTFKNNVFLNNNTVNSTSNSKWYFNLNAGVNGTSGTNIGSNNYLDGIPFESIFVNYSTGNNFYQNNFHVVNPAYVGDDGGPVGIYGGLYPWKEGSLPFNPHIQSMQVQSIANPDGTLHINAAVKAQQN